ncbi:hypothetical protein CROQUDRAFT_668678 [Cronartium quercuum f. sp. fusiforme G11]|uniref:Uncharacterized protein n=1 Tax=Cronartium quercuum f. sp. fusiforme G11 TaxID=708437 RepID=A0A9P6TGV7_9BASI|nr:hypothetical protein CROQUDRAFT_668678 [Cronartium quercuum f. sp. fusiforme G11]
MKNVLNRAWKTSSHRSLPLGSTLRGPNSVPCSCCLHLARYQNSSSQPNHPTFNAQKNYHTTEHHSDAFLESLESEIEAWGNTPPIVKSNDTFPKGSFLPPKHDCVSTNPIIGQSISKSRQPEGQERSSNSLQGDDAPHEAFIPEQDLDSLTEQKRREFFSNPDQMPELPDIAALKPPRLKKYLPGTPRIWYIDKFESISRRLMRAFTRPQLEHLCRRLGFQQSEDVGLNPRGIARLKELKQKNPSLSVKDLRAMVLAEANPSFEINVKKRDPSDISYTKTDLVHFVLTEHWGLTNPKSIPLPANFETLTHRYQTNSELFQVPYHEIFLLRLEQLRSPERNLISYLAQKSNVSVEFVQEPAGLMVRGEMKGRDNFWRSFEKLRRQIRKQTISISKHLNEVVVTPMLLKNLSELSGCYLELTSGPQGSLLAYSYHDDCLADKLADTLTQLALLFNQSSQVPLGICPSRAVNLTSYPRDLWLCPFLPVSKPSWHIASIADAFGRLTYPRSRSSSYPVDIPDLPEEVARQTGLHLDQVKVLSGPVSDLRAWLTDVGTDTDMSTVTIRATFGHHLYPRQGHSTLTGVKFSEDVNQLSQMSSWSTQVTPRPFFLSSFHGRSPPITLDGELASLSSRIVNSARADTNGEACVEIFRPVPKDSDPISRREEWKKSLRVTTRADGTIDFEALCQRHMVILMPDCPMDILFTVEKRTTPKISDELEGYQKGLTHIMHDGERFALMESYESQATEVLLENHVQSREPYILRNEWRIDSRFPNELRIQLSSELSLKHDPAQLEDFISISGQMASSAQMRNN